MPQHHQLNQQGDRMKRSPRIRRTAVHGEMNQLVDQSIRAVLWDGPGQVNIPMNTTDACHGQEPTSRDVVILTS